MTYGALETFHVYKYINKQCEFFIIIPASVAVNIVERLILRHYNFEFKYEGNPNFCRISIELFTSQNFDEFKELVEGSYTLYTVSEEE